MPKFLYASISPHLTPLSPPTTTQNISKFNFLPYACLVFFLLFFFILNITAYSDFRISLIFINFLNFLSKNVQFVNFHHFIFQVLFFCSCKRLNRMWADAGKIRFMQFALSTAQTLVSASRIISNGIFTWLRNF